MLQPFRHCLVAKCEIIIVVFLRVYTRHRLLQCFSAEQKQDLGCCFAHPEGEEKEAGDRECGPAEASSHSTAQIGQDI